MIGADSLHVKNQLYSKSFNWFFLTGPNLEKNGCNLNPSSVCSYRDTRAKAVKIGEVRTSGIKQMLLLHK